MTRLRGKGTITRRGLIAAGGRLAVAAADGGAVPRPDRTGAVRSGAWSTGAPASLGAEGRRTYAALVETVASSPGTLADGRRAREATAELARRYEASPPLVRSRIVEALRAVDDQQGSPFASLDVGQRLEHVRQRLGADRPSRPDGRPPAEAMREAIGLALAPFEPGDFRWEADAADIWIRTVRAVASGA